MRRGESDINKNKVIILMADDDPDDRLLAEQALAECGYGERMVSVEDGQALMDYLRRVPPYEQAADPSLILLDLNMPRKSGREALEEIRGDERLRSLPIIILTTSTDPEDVALCYSMGANSYIVKPDRFEDLASAMSATMKYWLETVELPGEQFVMR